MLERLNPVFRIVCIALAGLIVYQFSKIAFKRDVIARSSFNVAAIKTNAPAAEKTNATASAKKETNASSTNIVSTNLVSTNAASTIATPKAGMPPGITLPPGVSLPPGMSLPPGASMPPGMAMAMRGGPGGPPGRGGGTLDLPADVQAQIEKIKTSQILGPDVKPPPMALMGIGGKDAFLRAPNGQTGIIREGEELGGLKLLKIGTNRVLVEHEKQQKELIIFEGIGGESLMSKPEGKK